MERNFTAATLQTTCLFVRITNEIIFAREEAAMLLACQNISKAYGTNQILSDVSFHIEAREKIAIVGINGCGKTTLLKVIMGEEAADNGQVVISKEAAVGYLSQHQDISFDNTVYDEMLETKKFIIDMETKLRSLELDMKEYEGDRLEQIMNTYNKVQSEYDRLNGYAYKSEITGVLKGLGFSEADYNRHIRGTENAYCPWQASTYKARYNHT